MKTSPELLYRKQKINLASQLASKETNLILPCIIRQEDFEAFRRAEEKGEEENYFLNERPDLPESLIRQIVLYLALLKKLSPVGINRISELLSIGLPDHQEWFEIQSKGILNEYLYLKEVFQDRPGTAGIQTVLRLMEQEIRLIDNHTDIILALDPQLESVPAEDRVLSHIPDNVQLEALVEEGNSMILGQAVLRCLSPDEQGKLLAISEPLKPQIGRVLEKELVFYLQMEEDMTIPEVKQLLGSLQDLILYAAQQEDEPVFPAYLALRSEHLPLEYLSSPEYVGLLWQLSQLYKNIRLKGDPDYAAMIRLYEFITKKWAFAKEYSNIPAGDLRNAQISAYLNLATCYSQLWEWEEAVQECKSAARMASIYGLTKEFEGALFTAVNCLKECLQYRLALDYVDAALNGNGVIWEVGSSFELSPVMKNTMKIECMSLSEILPEDKKRIDIVIPSAENDQLQHTLSALERWGDQDHIQVDELRRVNKTEAEIYQQLEAYFPSVPFTPQEKAEQRLEFMESFYPDVEEYTAVLSGIRSTYPELPDDLKLFADLHQARLHFLNLNEVCLNSYELLLPAMEKYPRLFHPMRAGFWYCEYIRSLSLVNPLSSQIYKEIENAAKKAVNFYLLGFFNSFWEQSAWQKAQTEWDNIYIALLIYIKSCDSSELKQQLLRLLWNILVFNQQAFHRYQGMGAVIMPDEDSWKQYTGKLRRQLWSYYSGGQEEAALQAREAINEILQSVMPRFRDSHMFEGGFDPVEDTMVFHFFSKIDGKRQVLVLSYRKNGKDLHKKNYAYTILDDFDLFDPLISEQTDSRGILWKRNELMNLSQEALIMKQLSVQLADFLRPPGQFDKLIRRLMSEEPEEKSRLHIYADNFLHEFPLEMLSGGHSSRVGELTEVVSILHRADRSTHFDLSRGITFFSGVPELPSFPYLHNTTAEVDDIREEISGEKIPVVDYRGAKATIPAFLEALEAGPGILHLAVHGVADKMLHPGLVLAPVGEDQSSALLTYLDIMNRKLPFTDLVVLSACSSVVGRTQKGSPIQGMAYAFLRAGARCVVASRLPVSDMAARMIMKHFYRFLIEEGDVMGAMRKTRFHCLRNDQQFRFADIASWGVWT